MLAVCGSWFVVGNAGFRVAAVVAFRRRINGQLKPLIAPIEQSVKVSQVLARHVSGSLISDDKRAG
mgnify:CR=1 FL=1